ncbi:MAG: DNA internalization-related competence protein ComEC/Rec2 [Oleiphilaceae bacterium]|nr:DNA internalization-related competence protein ComEC/Rec2 [Oleiphilaceae bacterium]
MSWMAAFCAGIIILYCSGHLLPWRDYYLLGALALVGIRFHGMRLLLVLLLGYGYAAFQVDQQIQNQLPREVFGQVIKLEGWICSLPVESAFALKVDVCGGRIITPASRHAFDGMKVRLNMDATLLPDDLRPAYRFQVKLKEPRGRLNPLTRSSEQFWFRDRVVALGNIKAIGEVPEVKPSTMRMRLASQTLLHWRLLVRQHIEPLASHLMHFGLIQALLLGDRSAITHEENTLLSATGTQHLMAISGLHVGLVVGLLHLLLPRSSIGLVVISLLSLGYVLMVGAAPSAQRAWLMAMVLLLAGRGYIRINPAMVWLLALTLVLLVDASAMLSAGLWYSFVAVACLILMWRAGLLQRHWRSLLVMQVMLFLFLHGLNAWFGLPSHPLNILANLIAVPWVSLVVLPLVLGASLLGLFWKEGGQAALELTDMVLHVLMAFLDALVPLQGQINLMHSAWGWLLLFALVIFVVLLRPYRNYTAGILLVIATTIYFPFGKAESKHEILLWDAGQGLAVIMLAGNSVWLYDLGPQWGAGSLAERELLPYLRKVGRSDSIEGMILSHGDSDHVGGAGAMIEVLRPRQLWAGEAQRHEATRHALTCEDGMHWQEGAWRIEVIYANPVSGTSANNRSCVVMVQVAQFRLLLMGDLEGEGERHFLRQYTGDLRADVLVAGHHGSRHATSFALLKRVQPERVVLAAPFQSRFGHPHPDVLHRVQEMGAIAMHLGVTGALRVRPLKAHERYIWERARRQSFWLVPERSASSSGGG